MVLSYYFLKYPYKLSWNALNMINKRKETIFYAEDVLDLVIFKPVQQYLPTLPIVTKNSKIKREIEGLAEVQGVYPTFPKALITCRHICHKFPEEKILKFGLRHGAYHFKRFTDAKNYNAFTRYFMTSQHEVDIAKKCGINSAVAVGYPKLDPAFNGDITDSDLNTLHSILGFTKEKKTILFTATWDKSGMSAIDSWIGQLGSLAEKYNVLVTVHPWMSESYKNTLRNTPNIHFVEDLDVLPYLMLSDCVIGDTSSIIAEASALDKPIVTYKIKEAKRSLPEINELIQSISYQIDSKDALLEALEHALCHQVELQDNRQKANLLMFDKLDGKAGERAAKVIIECLAINDK